MKSACPSGISAQQEEALGRQEGVWLLGRAAAQCPVERADAKRSSSCGATPPPPGPPLAPLLPPPATGFAHSRLHSTPVAGNLTDGLTEAEELCREQTVPLHSLNPRRKVVPEGTGPEMGI